MRPGGQLELAGVPPLCAVVLCARGLDTPEKAREFLANGPELLHDPFLMRDMDRAAVCISQAVERGDTIAVYGDYDVDGITSTCLLTDFLPQRGRAGDPLYPRPDGGGLRPEPGRSGPPCTGRA